MTKKTKSTALALDKVTPQLLKKIEVVVSEHASHKYSVSRVYAAHNEAMGLTETPQSCASCLKTRAERLAKWLVDYRKAAKKDDGLAESAKMIKTPVGSTTSPVALEDKSEHQEVSDYDKFMADRGITADSSEEDQRAALTALLADGTIVLSEEGRAALTLVLEGKSETDYNEGGQYAGVILFTPDQAGAAYGIATLLGVPVPAGEYESEGVRYMVSGDAGNYTVLSGQLAAALDVAPVQDVNTAPQFLDPSADGFVAPELGVTRIPLADGRVVDFTPNTGEANATAKTGAKGLVKYADGTSVKAGRYTMGDGRELAVAIGGKGTIKEEDLT